MVATKVQRDTRKKSTAEVFTPPALVNQMLDKLPEEVWEEGKTFVDPACGNGNMLVPVLYRKIKIYGHNPSEALKTIYGVDIMRDNIRETRLRLLKTIIVLGYKITKDDIKTVMNNIVFADNKQSCKNGALSYNFSFTSSRPSKQKIDTWWKSRKKLLASVEVDLNDIEVDIDEFDDLEVDSVCCGRKDMFADE